MKIEYSPAYYPLLRPARYKGAHGGRGSGKSHFYAEQLVAKALARPGLHAVCIREVQKSLAQSAKRNVELKIQKFGVGNRFDVQKSEILTPGGGRIIFQGMQNHTADSIKSLEGFDVAWVEEAQTLSAKSLMMLRPTLRKKNSELWFSWNPRNRTDPVDELLRGTEIPPDAAVIQANYDANLCFGETELENDRLFDLRRDPDMYRHVWLGDYLTRSEAQVFRNWKVEWFEPPRPGERLLAGCDWGFIDPTVLIVCFVRGKTLYIWREAYALRCQLDRCPALFDKIDPNWTPQNAVDPNWRSMARSLEIVADNASPGNIDFMVRAGFSRMRKAIKGPDSVETGIAFMQSYDIVVHPDCVHVADELERYSYKVDQKQVDKQGRALITSELVDKHNHTIDSCRYALELMRNRSASGREELRI